MEKPVYDTFSEHHNKIRLEKIVGKYHPVMPIEQRTDDNRLTNGHVRKNNFKTYNILTGQKDSREKPLAEEFKSILELSTRGPLCPVPFVLDTMMGVCGYNCRYCMPAGTKILLASGRPQIKKIENMKPGDQVWGYDTETGKLVVNTVLELMERVSDNGYLTIKTDEYEVSLTDEHPVWTKDGWKEAKDLTINDEVIIFDSPMLKSRKVVSENMKKNNPMHVKEISDRVHEKNRASGMYDNGGMFGKLWQDINFRNKVSENLTNNNPMKNPEIAKKQGETRSIRIKNGQIDMSVQEAKFIENEMYKQGWSARAKKYGPTEPEQQLIKFFEENQLPFKYVGDGSLWINDGNPDFIDLLNGRHIIEFVGDTWHRNLDEYMVERAEYFKVEGFETLFIQYEDLNDMNKLKSTIIGFLSNPSLQWTKILEITRTKKPTKVYNIETTGTNDYFADGILVHNCFSALTVSSLMTAFFDSPEPLRPRYAKPETVRKTLTDVLMARGVEPYERNDNNCKRCGSVGETPALKKAAAQRIWLRLGTRSENFLPAERTHKAALEALKVVQDIDYPLIINTKSDLLLEDPYWKQLSEMNHKNLAVQVSITHCDDEMGKKLEPGAPKSSRRFKVLEMLNKSGIRGLIRMEPAMAFVNNSCEHLDEYFGRAHDAGVEHFLGDPFHHTVHSEAIVETFRTLGIDFDRMWEASTEHQITGSYVFEHAMYHAKKYGIKCGTFNYHSVPYSDHVVCCGVDDMGENASWNKYSMIHFLNELLVKKKLSWAEFDKKYYGYELNGGFRERLRQAVNMENQSWDTPDWMAGAYVIDDTPGNFTWGFDPNRLHEGFQRVERQFPCTGDCKTCGGC